MSIQDVKSIVSLLTLGVVLTRDLTLEMTVLVSRLVLANRFIAESKADLSLSNYVFESFKAVRSAYMDDKLTSAALWKHSTSLINRHIETYGVG